MSPKSSISKLTSWMVSPTSRWSSAILASSSLIACGEASSPPSGPGLTLAVAPLSLPGITDACYDLRVWVDKNGDSAFDGGDDVVWAKGNPAATKLGQDQTVPPGSGRAASSATADGDAICATQYGSATKGDITFIGSCDASGQEDADPAGEKTNRVTVWFDGLYNGTAEIGEWQDPCGTNGCTLDVLCEENADAKVEFNFTVMRDANQGFFDIAVNFKDIFCSAKLDTCYGSEPIKLLFGADSTRDWTAVFGFACTSGAGAVNDTRLMYGPLDIICGTAGAAGRIDGAVFNIDPLLAKGNQSVASGEHTLHYGIYRGAEQLNCDDASTAGVVESCNKLYWNLAFSLDDLAATGKTCKLAFSATATDGADFFQGFLATPSIAYPYIAVDATLTVAPANPANPSVISCQQHPLNGTGSAVKTSYCGEITGVPATPMCSGLSASGTSQLDMTFPCRDPWMPALVGGNTLFAKADSPYRLNTYGWTSQKEATDVTVSGSGLEALGFENTQTYDVYGVAPGYGPPGFRKFEENLEMSAAPEPGTYAISISDGVNSLSAPITIHALSITTKSLTCSEGACDFRLAGSSTFTQQPYSSPLQFQVTPPWGGGAWYVGFLSDSYYPGPGVPTPSDSFDRTFSDVGTWPAGTYTIDVYDASCPPRLDLYYAWGTSPLSDGCAYRVKPVSTTLTVP